MKIHTDTLTVHTQKSRELINITPQVKAAVQKSGITDGLILVSSLHINAAVIVCEDEPGLLEDLNAWLDQVAPRHENYKHGRQFESNAGVNLQTLLLNHQAVIPLAEGRADLGPWQNVFFVELDGGRPKRYIIKVMGE
jgi:secondary thiamine-phosphate synthase enzyme